MGTRCNIRIKAGDTKLWIYRHWDGYPAETGVDLARKLVNVKTADEFIAKLLKDDAYEVTTEQHGDIEYLYKINFCVDIITKDPLEVNQIYFKTLKRTGFNKDRDEDTFEYLDDYYRNQSEQDAKKYRESEEFLSTTTKKEILNRLGYYFRAALKMQMQSAEIQLKQDAYFHQLSDIEEE
tara:strand:+ start:832 stop:1371 length:540 start_codon:yes stop_codon:yes gene_type:complete